LRTFSQPFPSVPNTPVSPAAVQQQQGSSVQFGQSLGDSATRHSSGEQPQSAQRTSLLSTFSHTPDVAFECFSSEPTLAVFDPSFSQIARTIMPETATA